MKKIFTLVAMAAMAIGVNAQDKVTYDAVSYDGTTMTLASEFAAVVNADGVATNASDGKSIVEFTKGVVTCKAVGGTFPANAEGGGGAQQVTPGAPVSGKENIYVVQSVEKWNDITWKTTGIGGKNHSMNNGDKEPIYTMDGTGNPYVELQCEEIVTDGTPTGKYRAAYVYYEPDGSKGLPVTGLYYSFKSTQKGAFKVKVWANNGSRPTYVVNATKGSDQFAKAQELLAEGYINGQDWKQEDADAGTIDASLVGKRKYLTVDQVKAIHDAGNQANPYVIGAGNQHFWGYVVFDADVNEEYWVFQPSSQLGFGGFEFVPGAKKEEIVTGIEAVKTVAAAKKADAAIYNLAGQKVDAAFKGMVIQNGKKFINK